MPKSPQTDDRETVPSMVFDMDDTLTQLQANLDVLEELTKDYKLRGATDHQQNVDWVLAKVVGKTAELRERYDKLFEATRNRPEPAKPDQGQPATKAATTTPEAKPEHKLVRFPVTQADVDLSYEVADLLAICKVAAEDDHDNSIAGVIQQARDKWFHVHNALEGAQAIEDRP